MDGGYINHHWVPLPYNKKNNVRYEKKLHNEWTLTRSTVTKYAHVVTKTHKENRRDVVGGEQLADV